MLSCPKFYSVFKEWPGLPARPAGFQRNSLWVPLLSATCGLGCLPPRVICESVFVATNLHECSLIIVALLLSIVFAFFAVFGYIRAMTDDPYPYYAEFLLQVFNWMFPPLLKKTVEFYRWYFSTHKPDEQLYSASDLREMADSLPLAEDSQVDQLVEWIQHQPIADAVGVMDAIERRIEAAQQEPRRLLGHPDGAIDAVKAALLDLADALDQRT